MFILTCKHLYELNMRTENFSQILYLLQTFWFKAIDFSLINSPGNQGKVRGNVFNKKVKVIHEKLLQSRKKQGKMK